MCPFSLGFHLVQFSFLVPSALSDSQSNNGSNLVLRTSPSAPGLLSSDRSWERGYNGSWPRYILINEAMQEMNRGRLYYIFRAKQIMNKYTDASSSN